MWESPVAKRVTVVSPVQQAFHQLVDHQLDATVVPRGTATNGVEIIAMRMPFTD